MVEIQLASLDEIGFTKYSGNIKSLRLLKYAFGEIAEVLRYD
jgi:hypothetical protein